MTWQEVTIYAIDMGEKHADMLFWLALAAIVSFDARRILNKAIDLKIAKLSTEKPATTGDSPSRPGD